MERSRRVLWLLVAVGLGACRPGQAAESRAGVVTALEGAVTARRAVEGSARNLSLNAPIFQDDTVSTAADATVQIRLDHNGATWSLGSGQSARVEKSMAWNMAAGGRGDTALSRTDDKDRTSAAGRPATVDGVSSAETASGQNLRSRTALPQIPPRASVQAIPEEKRTGAVANAAGLGGDKGESQGLAQSGPGPGSGGGATSLAAPKGELKISRLQVHGIEQKQIQALVPGFRVCLNKGWARNPGLHGLLEIRFPIAADGSVQASGIEFTDKGLGDAEVLACIRGSIARSLFKAPTGDAPSVSIVLEAMAPP